MNVSKMTGLGIGAIAGAVVGGVWTALYGLSGADTAMVVGAHAVGGGAIAALASSLNTSWRAPTALVMAVVGGLFVAPVALAPAYALGWLTGMNGLAAIAAGMATGALLGLLLARQQMLGGIAMLVIGAVACTGSQQLTRWRDAKEGVPAARLDAGFSQGRLAVIGVDGADLQVIEPMLARGELQNFASVMRRGQHGVLRSIEPTLSPVVWTTIVSGHPAEVHGLQTWGTSDNRNRRVPMLWDLFDAHARDSVVVNVPGSWPPAPLEHGALMAGFPIPALVAGARGQLLGTFVSSDPSDQPVHTQLADPERSSQGEFGFSLPLISSPAVSRFSGARQPLLEVAVEDGFVGVQSQPFEGVVRMGRGGGVLVSDQIDGPATLPLGSWSQWQRVRTAGDEAYVRLFLVEGGDSEILLYVTPPFQNPVAPRYAFHAGDAAPALSNTRVPYVVEGIGWRAHRDERAAPLVPGFLGDLERVHANAALDLYEAHNPELFAYVITVTDRIQHPFWRLHDPEPYGELGAPHPGLEGEDPVEDAYRLADEILGRILRRLPEDTTLFIVSDHGVAPDVEQREGGHRVEGVWMAAGPGIEPKAVPHEMSILDVVPTALHCVGAPGAHDFAGRVSSPVCGPERRERVASYRRSRDLARPAAEQPEEVIDASREEQLRSLGYLE